LIHKTSYAYITTIIFFICIERFWSEIILHAAVVSLRRNYFTFVYDTGSDIENEVDEFPLTGRAAIAVFPCGHQCAATVRAEIIKSAY
jgi:hypothetical protein